MVDARRALSGIQVVELATGMAGETAGLMLAQYGADVVKVEALGADSSRRRVRFPSFQRRKPSRVPALSPIRREARR